MPSADSPRDRDIVEVPEQVHARSVFGLALIGAVIISTAISAQTYLSMLGHGHSFTRTLAWQLSCWSLWALAAPFVVRQAGALIGARRTPPWRNHVRLGAVGVVCVAAHVVLAAQLELWLQPYVPVASRGFEQAFLTQLETLLPVDVLAFVMLVLIGWALSASRMARQLAVRESRLEADLAKAQLEALRLEIQPHFLFNTLHAVAALIRSRSNERALEMLLGLSELMRQTLDRTREHVATLDVELDFTKRYVALQQARFGDRLDVVYRVADDCRTAAVPTFVLQPLVENALRHGLGRRTRPCQIEIGARIEGDGLHLWVSDDGAGLPAGFVLERDAGTGLRNTRSRLERLHGRFGRLTIGPRDGGGTVATLVVPLRPASRSEAIA